MPLPTKSEVDSEEDCRQKVISIEMNAGKSREQAVAIAHSHCDKLFELKKMKYEVQAHIQELEKMKRTIQNGNDTSN